MFGIRRDIVISAMLHFLMLAAAFFAGGSSEIRNRHLFTVSLLEELTEAGAIRQPAAVVPRSGGPSPEGREAEAVQRPVPVPLEDAIRKRGAAGTALLLHEPKTRPPADREGMPGSSISIELQEGPGEAQGAAAGPTSGIGPQGVPGTAIPSAALGHAQYPGAGEEGSLRQKIRSALQANLVYPYLARKKRMQGKVLIAFSINQKGLPDSIRIVKGSGHSLLDIAAQDTVIRASPFPVAGTAVEVPITFTLKDN